MIALDDCSVSDADVASAEHAIAMCDSSCSHARYGFARGELYFTIVFRSVIGHQKWFAIRYGCDRKAKRENVAVSSSRAAEFFDFCCGIATRMQFTRSRRFADCVCCDLADPAPRLGSENQTTPHTGHAKVQR